jgi:ornithine decarboxylase
MSCDGLDVIGRKIFLPKSLDVDDWLCFGGMGAYTYAVRTNFNGMVGVDRFCVLENKF